MESDTSAMPSPYAYPVDPFPDLALIYDTPVVKAFRIEPGRYLTIDIDGIEISWLSDSDEEIITIATSIGHRVVCTESRCKICAFDVETYGAEPYGFRRPDAPADPGPTEASPSPQSPQIPQQRRPESAPRRNWKVAAALVASGVSLILIRRGG